MSAFRMVWCLLIVFIPGPVIAKEDAGNGRFIERSVVTFPKVVDTYSLTESAYDPELWTAGVTTNWVAMGAPDGLRISVFAYPVGRMEEDDAVKRLMQDLKGSIRDARRAGMYSRARAGKGSAFVVDAPSAPHDRDDDAAKEPAVGNRDMQPSEGQEPEDEEASRRVAAALLSSLPPKVNRGRRQWFSITSDGVAHRSLAYIFYRQLFAFKVRVSAPEDAMDAETFEALADTAVRHLVPAFEAENFGECSTVLISVPARRPTRKDEEKLQIAIGREVGRVVSENCAKVEAFAHQESSDDTVRVDIVYPDDAWRQEP